MKESPMSIAALRPEPANAPAAAAPDAPARDSAAHVWHRAFRDLPRQHGFQRLAVEGRLPEGLRGTLHRNGPSLFSTFGRRYGHWFDGDGAVSAVRFDGQGGATGAVRIVDGIGLTEERRLGRPRYGNYGTRAPSAWRGLVTGLTGNLKNSANTSVMVWQGRLYALLEAARPTELSLEDLTTLGERDLGGAVLKTFSAHPHYVASRKSAYNFGVRYGRKIELDVYALPDDGAARRLTTVTLGGATMVHDFIATDRHLVFFAPPLRLRLFRMLLGIGSYSENLRWRPDEGTEVIIVPIDAPEKVQRFRVPAFYQWHFAAAFERGEELIVDYVRYPDFASNRWLGEVLDGPASSVLGGALHRAVVDPARGTLRDEPLSAVPCEFPRVARTSAANRFVYAATHSSAEAARGMFDQIARFDVERGTVDALTLGAGQYPSEPVFVRRPDARAEPGGAAEADGWLLTLVYDGNSDRSGVAVLDARDLARGPLACAWFDHHIPFTFHGNFTRS
jgi:all-trans-8'-apo-beta-carotenal 15,15'-oxygenase